MSHFAYDRLGGVTGKPNVSQMRELLDSLAHNDPEHPDVSLEHESGWGFSAFPSGLIIFENAESDEGPWHMRLASLDQVIPFWCLLAEGNIEELQSLDWKPGYGQ